MARLDGDAGDGLAHAAYIHDAVVPLMDALRAKVDELETCVDGTLWPVPTYVDLMFKV